MQPLISLVHAIIASILLLNLANGQDVIGPEADALHMAQEAGVAVEMDAARLHVVGLDFRIGQVTDSAPAWVASFPELRRIRFERTHISDLAPLSNLANLKELVIDRCTWTASLAPLGWLSELEVFQCIDTPVEPSEYQVLRKWPKLIELSVGIIADRKFSGSDYDCALEPLAGCRNLTTLRLYWPISCEQFERLATLQQLQVLELVGPKVRGDELRSLQVYPRLRSIRAGMTGATIQYLATLPQLESLDLTGLGDDIDDAIVHELPKLQALTSLQLRRTSVTDLGISEIGALRNLRRLSLPEGVSDQGLAHLEGLSNLEELDLTSVPITDAGLRRLGQLKSLRRLILGATGVTGEGLEAFKGHDLVELELFGTPLNDEAMQFVNRFSKLQLLDLSGTHVTDSGLAKLTRLDRLTSLDLSGLKITAAGLAHLKYCKALEKLHVGNTLLDDSTGPTLAEFVRLQKLFLDGTGVTDRLLSDLPFLKDLRRLELSNTKVTDSGARRIATAFGELSYLGLSVTKCTDQCLTDLAKLQLLEVLLLRGCSVTDDGLVALKPLVRLILLGVSGQWHDLKLPAGAKEPRLKRELPRTDIDFRGGAF